MVLLEFGLDCGSRNSKMLKHLRISLSAMTGVGIVVEFLLCRWRGYSCKILVPVIGVGIVVEFSSRHRDEYFYQILVPVTCGQTVSWLL